MPTPERLRRAIARTTAAIALALLALPLATHAENWRWNGIEKVVAISDVHGAYKAMVRTLQNAEVLDDEETWAGAQAHLVVTGDLLDRGPDSRRVMDLLMRLESEAAAAGGRVHVLLGNHEVMNLTGDLRYVSMAEYAAFVDEEEAADRERAFEAFKSTHPEITDDERLEHDFAMRAPPGFFGLKRAFSPQGTYGQWLLQKPLMVVINDTAFVHGGVSPMVADLGLNGINKELKAQVSRYAEQLEVVTEAGLLDPTENFHRHGEVLEALPEDAGRPQELQDAIVDVIRLNNASVHDIESPLWYRGNVGCVPLIENDKLDASLAALDADRVVIGHTPTVSRRVLQRLGGRVVEIDTGMLSASYGGTGNALMLDGAEMRVVNERGEGSVPIDHPRTASLEHDASADELERILAEGELQAPTKDESGRIFVKVSSDGKDVQAEFIRNPRGKGFVPELAAYRLDRLVSLDMIPVTVAREVEGDAGVLQVFTPDTKDEKTRSASGDGFSSWCPLPEQWNAMYVFDALAHNELRRPETIRYNPGNWQLILTGHDRAFATKSGRPAWLKAADLHLGDAWMRALSSLSDDVLEAELGDLLDKRRLASLRKRRDALMEGSL